jgi:hypothetical protein
MKNINKENKNGLSANELTMDSKEILAILNGKIEVSIDIEERNKKFDMNFNNLNYNIQIKKIHKDLRDFSHKFYDQTLILAMGGHENALRFADQDILIDILNNECDKEGNSLLKQLRSFYNTLDHFANELYDVIGLQTEFIEKQEVEVFMKDWYV